jgi:hypothetical protein
MSCRSFQGNKFYIKDRNGDGPAFGVEATETFLLMKSTLASEYPAPPIIHK